MAGLPHSIIPGRACGALFDVPGIPRFFAVSFYGDTYSEDRTIDALEQVLHYCHDTAHPFVVGGDFNVEPAVLRNKLGTSPTLGVAIQVVATREGTCHTAQGDSVLDYFLLGGGAQMLGGRIRVDDTVPVKPHSAVAIDLKPLEHYAGLGIKCWKRYSRGSATPVIGPHWEIEFDWSKADDALLALQGHCDEMTPEDCGTIGPNEALDGLLEEAWRQVLAECMRDAIPRFGLDPNAGGPIKLEDMGKKAPGTFLHRPSISRYLAWQRKQINRAIRDPCSTTQVTVADRMGSLDPKMPMTSSMCDLHVQWQRWWTHLAQLLRAPGYKGHLSKVFREFSEQVKKWEAASLSHETAANRARIKAWKDKLFQGPGLRVHSWSKTSRISHTAQVLDHTGYLTSNPAILLQHTVQQWTKVWQAVREPPTASMLTPHSASQLPELTVEAFAWTTKNFKSSTSVPDGIHPSHYGRLPGEALCKVVQFLRLCEQCGRLPISCREAVIRMLPKPRGGHRPIALFRSLFRAWGKARTPILAAWAKSLCTAVFAMSPGRRVTDGLYRDLCRALLSQVQAKVVLEAHFDVAKFFDHIRRFPLVQVAATMGYPMQLLRISLSTYAGARRIVMDEGVTSEPLWGTEGVMAGSPHAVYETVAYLALSVRAFQQQFPSPVHSLSVFVDDLALRIVQPGNVECMESFAHAGAWLISEFLDKLGLPIEQEKTFLLGSNDEVVRLATKSMGALAGAHGVEVRKLGATYSLQHRSHRKKVKAKQTRDRIAKALARHRRIVALAGSRVHGTVFQTGVLQEAAFGAELALMAPRDLDKLRIAAVRAHGLQGMGISHKMSILGLPLDRDPRWHIDCRILSAFSREAWNLSQAPHLDHLTAREFAGLFSLPLPPVTTSYAQAWKDPISTLRATMDRMNIKWTKPMVWTYKGMEMHLQAGTPALLPRLLRAGARQAQLDEAAFPGAPVGWQAPFLHAVLDTRNPKKALSTTGKKALLSFLAGRYPTRSVLASWGFQVQDKCPHCGLKDTAFHRIWRCNMASDAEGMTKKFRNWTGQPLANRGILVLPPPVKPQPVLDIQYSLFGRSVTAAQFGCFLPADGPVYIDGSVLHGKTPFASAGWAAVQVVGGVVSRSIMAPLDPDFPASSDFAEHVGCHFAASHASEGKPIEIVSDCASVLSYFHAARQGKATAYSKPLGGVWADFPLSSVTCMHKIKSHLSYEQAVQQGMGQWWAGNSFADKLAQEAAAMFTVPAAAAAQYAREQRFASAYLRSLAAALTGWKGEQVYPTDLPKVAQPTGRRLLPKHEFEWDPDRNHWACRRCWKRRVGTKQGADHSGCKAINPIEAGRVHRSHRLRFAQGPWGSRPLMYCSTCGHYSTSRFAALVGECTGRMGLWGDVSSAYRLYLRTIRRGKHPTLPRFSLGHQYTPVRQWGPAPEVAALEADASAAKLLLEQPPVPEEEPGLAAQLAALEQLEVDEWAACHESEEDFAVGEGFFLGFDSP
jgi:hypothetical protein